MNARRYRKLATRTSAPSLEHVALGVPRVRHASAEKVRHIKEIRRDGRARAGCQAFYPHPPTLLLSARTTESHSCGGTSSTHQVPTEVQTGERATEAAARAVSAMDTSGLMQEEYYRLSRAINRGLNELTRGRLDGGGSISGGHDTMPPSRLLRLVAEIDLDLAEAEGQVKVVVHFVGGTMLK